MEIFDKLRYFIGLSILWNIFLPFNLIGKNITIFFISLIIIIFIIIILQFIPKEYKHKRKKSFLMILLGYGFSIFFLFLNILYINIFVVSFSIWLLIKISGGIILGFFLLYYSYKTQKIFRMEK